MEKRNVILCVEKELLILLLKKRFSTFSFHLKFAYIYFFKKNE